MNITKDTLFVREIKVSGKVGYFVDEIYTNGVYNISITNDPLKARLYTFKEVYENTYNRLSENQKECVRKAHKDNYSYGILAGYVADEYKIITVNTIDYGYKEDIKTEYNLLAEIGLEYMVAGSIVTNIENEGD